MAEQQTPKATILWTGKRRSDGPAFVQDLEDRGYWVSTAATGKEARDMMPGMDPDILIIDASSMRTTGTRLCRSFQSKYPDLPIILINSPEYLPSNEVVADIHLIMPFTIRKLENRIIPLSPGDGDQIIKAGPIHLDVDRQLLKCRGREDHITPRMVELISLLIEHQGDVVEREILFSKVWKTDYTKDTRSLDVHINWLRKVIEDDPGNPELLRTVRGKGYILDIDN
jgi:DNA-binding response OmpR family regulator